MRVITGIGRSGTSITAEYAKQCGVYIGEAKWIPMYDAGNEDRELIDINNSLFKSGLTRNTEERILRYNVPIAKDPSFIRSPKILEAWNSVRDDIEIVYCSRYFQDIANSQKRKPQMTCPAYRCFPELMEQVQKDFLKACVRLGVKVTMLTYPYTPQSYLEVNKALGIKNDGELFKKILR